MDTTYDASVAAENNTFHITSNSTIKRNNNSNRIIVKVMVMAKLGNVFLVNLFFAYKPILEDAKSKSEAKFELSVKN